MCGHLWRFLTGSQEPHTRTEPLTLPARYVHQSHLQETFTGPRYELLDDIQPCHDFYFAAEVPTTTPKTRRPAFAPERQLESRLIPAKSSVDVEQWRRRLSASHRGGTPIQFGDPFPKTSNHIGEAWVSSSEVVRSFDLATTAASTAMQVTQRQDRITPGQAPVGASDNAMETRACAVCLEDLELRRFVSKALHEATAASHGDDTCLSCWKRHIHVAVEGSGTTVHCTTTGCGQSLTEQEVRRRASPKRYAK